MSMYTDGGNVTTAVLTRATSTPRHNRVFSSRQRFRWLQRRVGGRYLISNQKKSGKYSHLSPVAETFTQPMRFKCSIVLPMELSAKAAKVSS